MFSKIGGKSPIFSLNTLAQMYTFFKCLEISLVDRRQSNEFSFVLTFFYSLNEMEFDSFFYLSPSYKRDKELWLMFKRHAVGTSDFKRIDVSYGRVLTICLCTQLQLVQVNKLLVNHFLFFLVKLESSGLNELEGIDFDFIEELKTKVSFELEDFKSESFLFLDLLVWEFPEVKPYLGDWISLTVCENRKSALLLKKYLQVPDQLNYKFINESLFIETQKNMGVGLNSFSDLSQLTKVFEGELEAGVCFSTESSKRLFSLSFNPVRDWAFYKGGNLQFFKFFSEMRFFNIPRIFGKSGLSVFWKKLLFNSLGIEMSLEINNWFSDAFAKKLYLPNIVSLDGVNLLSGELFLLIVFYLEYVKKMILKGCIREESFAVIVKILGFKKVRILCHATFEEALFFQYSINEKETVSNSQKDMETLPAGFHLGGLDNFSLVTYIEKGLSNNSSNMEKEFRSLSLLVFGLTFAFCFLFKEEEQKTKLFFVHHFLDKGSFPCVFDSSHLLEDVYVTVLKEGGINLTDKESFSFKEGLFENVLQGLNIWTNFGTSVPFSSLYLEILFDASVDISSDDAFWDDAGFRIFGESYKYLRHSIWRQRMDLVYIESLFLNKYTSHGIDDVLWDKVKKEEVFFENLQLSLNFLHTHFRLYGAYVMDKSGEFDIDLFLNRDCPWAGLEEFIVFPKLGHTFIFGVPFSNVALNQIMFFQEVFPTCSRMEVDFFFSWFNYLGNYSFLEDWLVSVFAPQAYKDWYFNLPLVSITDGLERERFNLSFVFDELKKSISKHESCIQLEVEFLEVFKFSSDFSRVDSDVLWDLDHDWFIPDVVVEDNFSEDLSEVPLEESMSIESRKKSKYEQNLFLFIEEIRSFNIDYESDDPMFINALSKLNDSLCLLLAECERVYGLSINNLVKLDKILFDSLFADFDISVTEEELLVLLRVPSIRNMLANFLGDVLKDFD